MLDMVSLDSPWDSSIHDFILGSSSIGVIL